MSELLHCAGLSCAATLEIDHLPRPGDGTLEEAGWAWLMLDGDYSFRAYCPRDQE